MIRVMFVCHGNICRSPMAEFVFRELARRKGAEEHFSVASSATSTEEIWNGVGSPMYPPAREELRRYGIPFDARRAVLLRAEDAGKYDLFVGMDHANVRNMSRILGSAGEGKIRLLMDFTDRGGEVADPWYSDRFDVAYRDIRDGCEGLLKHLLQSIE